MKTIAFVIYLIISSVGTLFSQEYDFEVHVPCDSLQYGYGIEAGIRLMNYSGEDGIQFAVTTSGHLQWELHTDTLYEPGYTVLSLKADDVYFNGPVNVEITGIRQNEYLKKTLTINVYGEENHPSFGLPKTCLQQSLDYLKSRFPEFKAQFSEVDTSQLFCYYPYPAADIVRHTTLLSNHWRIVVQEHVMVPPYDWKRIFLWNAQHNLYFGLEIDTHGELHLVPCQVKYYFENINYLPLEIMLSNSSIREDNALNALIGALSTRDNFDTLTYQYKIINGASPFLISNGNELLANAVYHYEKDTAKYVDILSRNEMGYGITKTCTISVLKNTDPTGTHGHGMDPDGFHISNSKIYFTVVYDAIEVYDVTGRMIRSGWNTSNINLDGLESSILLFRLYQSSSVRSLKIFY